MFEDQEFHTLDYRESRWRQSASIMVSGRQAGTLEIYYLEEKPELDEGPFLKEERDLIEALALEVGKYAERKQAERAMAESEREYRILFERSSDAIVVHDLKGNILDANSRAAALLDDNIHQVVKQVISELKSGADLDDKEAKFGQAIQREHIRFETQLKKRDGEVLHVDISARVVDKKKGTVQIMARDVTERKQAEETRKESQRYTRELIEASLNPFVTISSEGKITDVNHATELVTGYPREKLVGTDFSDYFTDPQRAREGYQKVFKEGYVRDYALEIKHRDGKATSVFYDASVYHDRKGNVAGVFAAARDVTERKRAEEKLKLFSQAVNSSVDGIAMGNLEGRVTYVNKAFTEMFGYSREDLIGKEIASLYAEGQIPKLEDPIKATIEDGWAGELVARRKDGKLFPIVISASRIMDDEGGVIAQMASHQDITERRRAEEALRESEEKFRTLAEQSPNMIFINKKGTIVWANQKCEEIVGYNREQLCSPDFDFLSLIAPDHRDLVKEMFGRHMKREEIPPYEFALVSKQGKRIEVINSTKLITYEGERALLGMITDITERKQAEELLSRTVAEYTAMIDTVPAIMYAKDIHHRYITVNEAFCRFAGKSSDEIIGNTDHDIFPREKADEYHKADKIVMDEDRRVLEHEQSIKDTGGEAKWISTTKVPLHDSQGLVSGVVGQVQDVTEYHRSREQLIQSDKLAAIGTLAAGVAHEINNPIGFISSNLNTMNKYLKRMNSYIERTGTAKDEDKEAILEILTDFVDAVDESTEGTTRVKNIVADLKSFSRVDRSEKELTNINEGIESTLNIVWNELKYHCKVEKDLGNIPDLYCIPNQLNQVYMNLLLNAGYATKGQSGLINIRTWADDGNIYVSVKDNGVGIPEENVKKIFEPFFTTKEVGQGTGLGLSLAFDIIKKHGGNIEVKSEVGVGTEFIVALPCEGVPVG